MLLITLSGTDVLLAGGGLVLGLLLLTFLLRRSFASARGSETSELDRAKYRGADVHRFRPTFFRLGLVLTLALTTLAFSWTSFETRPLNVTIEGELFHEMTPPPVTDHRPPPPPPPPPVIETVDNNTILEDTSSFTSLDIQADAPLSPPAPVAKAPATPPHTPPPPPREEIPHFFKVVEEMPYFGDCQGERDRGLRKQCSDRALIGYLSEHLRYPALARESGISGVAVIRFIVEKDGSLTNIEVLRDPGGGLGAEAARVVGRMAAETRWTPGRQTGRPVRVQFNLPVRFQLDPR